MAFHRAPVSLGLALAALAAGSAPAAAQAPAPTQSSQRTLTVIATGRVPVARPKTLSNATIAAAVETAQNAVAPAAIAAAREAAVQLGYAADLTVLGLVSVADVAPSPFGPFGYGVEGTFGPGRYCGTIRTPVRRRVNGIPRPTGRFRTRHTCRVPRDVTRTISATYEVTPKS